MGTKHSKGSPKSGVLLSLNCNGNIELRRFFLRNPRTQKNVSHHMVISALSNPREVGLLFFEITVESNHQGGERQLAPQAAFLSEGEYPFHQPATINRWVSRKLSLDSTDGPGGSASAAASISHRTLWVSSSKQVKSSSCRPGATL